MDGFDQTPENDVNPEDNQTNAPAADDTTEAQQAYMAEAAKVFGEGDPDLTPEANAASGEIAAAETQERQPAEEKAEASAESQEPPREAKTGESDQKADTSVPQSLLERAAEQSGMSVEELNQLRDSNPELAEKVFTKLSDELVTESLRLARAGTAGGQGDTSPQSSQSSDQSAGDATSKLDAMLKTLSDENLQAFEDAQGPEFVSQFLRPFRDTLQELKQQVVDPVQDLQTQLTAREQESLQQTVNQAFSSLGDEEFYGKDQGTLTKDQVSNRERVAQLADQIRAGAWAQGQDLAISEAIQRAHSIVSSGRQHDRARKELMDQVKKQSKGLVSKPSSATNPTPGTDEAASSAYRQRAAELGLNVGF